MNDIEKLFRKIGKKERSLLLGIIEALVKKDHKGLVIKKLEQSDFYRLRKGSFRIIFHYGNTQKVIIDAVRLKGEDTYKDFM